MNYNLFAEKLNVAFGEKFKIAYVGNESRCTIEMTDGRKREKAIWFVFKLEKDGLYRRADNKYKWDDCKKYINNYTGFVLGNIVDGMFTVVKISNIADGDYYYTVSDGAVVEKCWEGDNFDMSKKRAGLIFLDKEDAESHLLNRKAVK